ncbi:MAG: type IV pilin protein [Pseudomonadales bacterium]
MQSQPQECQLSPASYKPVICSSLGNWVARCGWTTWPLSKVPWSSCSCWSSGFTLIELLLALAITAILSLIVVPSYQAYIQQSHRVTAQTDLTTCAQRLRNRAGSGMSYLNFADTNGDGLGNSNTGPIASDVCTPVSHIQGNYQLSIRGTLSEFALTATSVNDNRNAGALGLASTGAKFWDENADGIVGFDENDWLAVDEI